MTYDQLDQFLLSANRYLVLKSNEPRNTVFIALTKLVQKYSKMLTRYKEDIEDACEDLKTDYCIKDAKGNLEEEKVILKDAKGSEKAVYKKKYTPENEKELRRAIRELTRQRMDSTVDFQPHYVEIPKDFDELYKIQFTGFIFRDETGDLNPK